MKTTSAFINPNQSVWFYCQTLICGIKINIFKYFLLNLLLINISFIAPHAHARKIELVEGAPDNLSPYEEIWIYRKQSHFIDHHIWVYSKEFSERFGMPKKWINDELKGAQALAYRIDYNTTQRCGLFGKNQNCGQTYQCVLDIYMDEKDSAKLPWYDNYAYGREAKPFDVSHIYMLPQNKEDKQYKSKQIKEWGLNGYSMQSFFNSNGKLGYSQGIGLIEYRKQIYPNLDYLSFNTGCGINEDPSNDMKFVLYFRSKKESRYRDIHSLAKSIHLIEIPISFHKRISSYKKDNHEKRSIWYKVKKELQKGAK